MNDRYTLHHGDCIAVMRTMPVASVDAIVTDPPYGINFMGKAWDNANILAKAVPGQDHTKTRERSASMHAGEYDVSLKGNQAFEEWTRVWAVEAFRILKPGGYLLCFSSARTYHRMAAGIEDAGFEIRDQIMWIYGSGFPKSLNLKDEWQGWGTALKPAHEPIVLARKPLIGTVAANVLAHGTGALNINGTRVGTEVRALIEKMPSQHDGTWDSGAFAHFGTSAGTTIQGRWPANVIHDGSDEVVEHFGDAHRFFYCAKASKRDRNEGLDGFKERKQDDTREEGRSGGDNPRNRGVNKRANHHPTVKPTNLMRYLIRLITPPQGVVLDPFMGSGSTGKAAMLEGNTFIGIEQDADYLAIADARIRHALNTPLEDVLFKPDELPDTEIAQLANPGTLFDNEASA